MTSWVLVALIALDEGMQMIPSGVYPTMTKCFEARQYFMLTAPQPKINYEAVCVQTDKAPE